MLDRVESCLRRLPNASVTRYALVAILLVLLATLYVPLMKWMRIHWVFALLLWALIPAVLAPLAPRNPILFGLLGNVATLGNAVFFSNRSSSPGWWWDPLEMVGWLFFSIFPIGAGILMSLPSYFQRQHSSLSRQRAR